MRKLEIPSIHFQYPYLPEVNKDLPLEYRSKTCVNDAPKTALLGSSAPIVLSDTLTKVHVFGKMLLYRETTSTSIWSTSFHSELRFEGFLCPVTKAPITWWVSGVGLWLF